MTWAQDLDTGDVVELPRPRATEWVMARLADGHRPYMSETRIPPEHGAAYRQAAVIEVEDWSV